MQNSIARALPGEHLHITMNADTEPFWRAAQQGRLSVPRCLACSTHRNPIHAFCPKCHSRETEWVDLPGTATVYSFAICHNSPYPEVEPFDYVPAVVDLDGAHGIKLVTNIVDVPWQSVEIGMRVSVGFHPIAEGWAWPVFRPLID